MKESPINPYHRRQGAHIGMEEGWQMPATYTDVLQEHQATRAACGIFDISHLGKFCVLGYGALSWLESMLSNKIATCGDGEGQHTLMLGDNGGIIDRLTLFRESEECYRLWGSAALATEDEHWLSAHLPDKDVFLQNETERWSGMAVYGPQSREVFQRVLPGVSMPGPMQMQHPQVEGEELLLTACGLEGDEGFELWCPAIRGIFWFESFVRAGARPCGMATRECLRQERHIASPGRDMNSKTTPEQAHLTHLCDAKKRFVGAPALHRRIRPALHKKLTPLECTAASPPPRHGQTVQDEQGNCVGFITSGCTSPATGLGIGFAYLSLHLTTPGTKLSIVMEGKAVPAVVSGEALR